MYGSIQLRIDCPVMSSVPISQQSRPRLSLHARERIRQLTDGIGCSTVTDIVEALKSEAIITCRQTVWQIQCHIERHGTPKCKHSLIIYSLIYSLFHCISSVSHA